MDIEKLKLEARNELNLEMAERAKEKIKKKITELINAKQLVANIERELTDLELEIKDGII